MERLKLKVAVYLILINDDKILLSRRLNTGWNDGNYTLPSGHLDPNETIVEAMIREAQEEAGVTLDTKDMTMTHTMHRFVSSYIDFYFMASKWQGEPQNMEPDKCDEVAWFLLDNLPTNVIPSVKLGIENSLKGIPFSESELG